VRVAVLGATGRTGRIVVDELLRRGHEVVALVRDRQAAGLPAAAQTVSGDARDPSALGLLLEGAQAVVSALGPRRGDATLHREVAGLLVEALPAAGVRRFVGISGAGIDVPGDEKGLRDRVVSRTIQRLGGQAVHDKAVEHQVWAASGLDWTLVRPPRPGRPAGDRRGGALGLPLAAHDLDPARRPGPLRRGLRRAGPARPGRARWSRGAEACWPAASPASATPRCSRSARSPTRAAHR
jgi:putative NADH-flavin reductase